MKVSLIAGHGAGDPGAIGTYNGKTYREADEARTLVKMISSHLQRTTAEIYVFDMTHNAYKDYCAHTLNFPAKLDFVLEIHFNAVKASNADNKTKGVECYITSSEKNTTTAAALCKAISAFGLTNRGVKQRNFSVISAARNAKASSALLEVCFIDDPDDWKVYLANQEKIAEAIAKTICTEFNVAWREASSRQIVQEAAGLTDATMDYLQKYRYGDALLDKLALAITKK